MKILLILPLLVYYVESQVMSEKQLKSATKLIRNVCQPKNKVTNDQIAAVHRGEFAEDRPLKCYMECALRTGKLMKNGKFDLQSALAQASTLPTSRQQSSIDGSNYCKDSATSDDKCEAALQIYKCIYFFNPDNFFLP